MISIICFNCCYHSRLGLQPSIFTIYSIHRISLEHVLFYIYICECAAPLHEILFQFFD